MASTFWTAMVSSSAALCERSPSECAQRVQDLVANNATFDFGREPKVLESWSRLSDGRITGRLDSRTVWVTVEAEGRLASDPREGPGYIESLGGRIYELGEPATGPVSTLPTAAARPSGGDELERWGILKGVVRRLQLSPQAEAAVPVLLSFALVGGVGFELGQQNILLNTEPPALEAPAPQYAPAPQVTQSRPAAERASLTVSEQRARQELRVLADETALEELKREAQRVNDPDMYSTRLEALKKRVVADQEGRLARDQAAVDGFDARVQRERDSIARRTASMELRLRQDKEGVAELTRVESERGADARAVQLGVFPAASGLDPTSVPRSAMGSDGMSSSK